MSQLQVAHLDGFSKVHKHDVASNRAFLGEVLGNADVVKLSDEHVIAVMGECGFDGDIQRETFVPFSDLHESFQLVENICFEDGQWTAKKGDEWLKFVKNIVDDESEYRERGHAGNHKLRSRGASGLTGERFTEPLNVIFARTPPWLALILDDVKDEKLVKSVITRIGARFAAETGYSVKAVNIHRESKHDLHIHIMYSDLEKHFKPVSVRNRKAQVAALKKVLAVELAADPNMTADKTSVLREYRKRNLESHVQEYSDEYSYRKVLRRTAKDDGEWPIEKRRMTTMGTAYRYKAWLWDAASSQSDKDAIRDFRDSSTINGNFTNRVANVKNLNDQYLDWWLERELANMLLAGLSPARITKVDGLKKQAVANYLKYGQSVAHPMQKAVLRQKMHLERQSDIKSVIRDIEIMGNEWDQQKLANRESIIELHELDAEFMLATAIIHKVGVERSKEQLSAEFVKLTKDRNQLETDQKLLAVKSSEVTKNLKTKESELVEHEQKVRTAIANLVERDKEVALREISITSKEDTLREEGRREILDKITSITTPPPSVSSQESDEKKGEKEKPPAKAKTQSQILKEVTEITKKAILFDKIEPIARAFIEKIKSLKKIPFKWMSTFANGFKSVFTNEKDQKKDNGLNK